MTDAGSTPGSTITGPDRGERELAPVATPGCPTEPVATKGGGPGLPQSPARSLKSRAVRGTLTWLATYVFMQFIRIGGNVWLAALLAPWTFGLVAIARAIQQGLTMFTELGIRPALIQSRRDDEAFVNTAWTLGIIRGAGIWVIASALAYPLAMFYQQDALVEIVPVLALTAVLGGLESTRGVSMNRELREGPRALMEIAASIVSRAVMIAWAYVAPDPWALVAGTIAGSLCSVLISHLLLPGVRNRLRLERDAARAILKFGTWIFVGTVIAFLGQQLDKIMLGKLDTLAMLGVYTMALTLAAMPREIMATISGKILYPVLAEIARQDPHRYAARVSQIRGMIVPVGMGCILTIVFASPWFFSLLYNESFRAATWISPLACAATWIAILNGSANKALLALARTRALAFAGLTKVILTAIGCTLGYQWLGVGGFVLGVAVGAAGEHGYNLITLHRAGISLIRADALMTLLLAALACAGWFAADVLRPVLPGTGDVLGAMLGGRVGEVGAMGIEVSWAIARAEAAGLAPPLADLVMHTPAVLVALALQAALVLATLVPSARSLAPLLRRGKGGTPKSSPDAIASAPSTGVGTEGSAG